jgi:hypothetical protein
MICGELGSWGADPMRYSEEWNSASGLHTAKERMHAEHHIHTNNKSTNTNKKYQQN